jgi:nucleoside-diphosphate kinase
VVSLVAIERTFSIIKPDAVSKSLIGEICRRFEKAGLQIGAAKMVHLTRRQAEGFYAVHKDRSFFNNLIDFMTSGPIMVQVLEGGNAIALNRKLMGATNPSDAELGTIRADYATDIKRNAVHGSDGPDTAKEEIAFFFSEDEICSRTL